MNISVVFMSGWVVRCWNGFPDFVVAIAVKTLMGSLGDGGVVGGGMLVLLREDERLELIYDQDKKLRAIQKIRLSQVCGSMEGKAETDIVPMGRGRVWFQGALWKAHSDSSSAIIAGQRILVKARHNLTLLVIAMED